MIPLANFAYVKKIFKNNNLVNRIEPNLVWTYCTNSNTYLNKNSILKYLEHFMYIHGREMNLIVVPDGFLVLTDNLHDRLTFNLGKKDEIPYHS